jgi:hypothetical protein
VDDGDASHENEDLHRPSGSAVIIRWWRESGAQGPDEEGRALRGNLRDLRGGTIGSFAGIDTLFRLLRRILSERPQPPS